MSLEDQLQCRIIMGDCLLYQSILTFINQDIPSYIKGGWLLRKAWKIYHKTHKDIQRLYDKVRPAQSDSVDPPPLQANATGGSSIPYVPSGTSLDGNFEPESGHVTIDGKVYDVPQESTEEEVADLELDPTVDLSLDVAERLLGSVSFGYGSLQLCMSLVPPKILKIIEFLGFDGDRQSGLAALDVASKSRDMKAPLAM